MPTNIEEDKRDTRCKVSFVERFDEIDDDLVKVPLSELGTPKDCIPVFVFISCSLIFRLIFPLESDVITED